MLHLAQAGGGRTCLTSLVEALIMNFNQCQYIFDGNFTCRIRRYINITLAEYLILPHKRIKRKVISYLNISQKIYIYCSHCEIRRASD